MSKRPTVHFSNRLEELAYQLGNELFKEGADPFAKRLVLLPSHSLKLYLTSFFANHPRWSVCSGITFKTLLNGAFCFFPEEELKEFPSPMALSFMVEQELAKDLEEDQLLEIKQYLEPFSNQKRIWLAEELSRLFYEYSTSEGKSLKEWKEKKGWKQIVWQRVFAHAKCLCLELEKKTSTDPEEVHLFGFAHVPSPFYQFFSTLGMHIYFLSPSTCFWEDLCSDKERIFLEKKMEGKKVRLQVKEQMSFLLKQMHPLLANWGRVGRSLLRQLGDTESYLEEEYEDPLIEGDSALTYIQAGLFELEETKRELALEDTSILCLSAPSKLREVEVLFETLQELMALHKDVEPKDILVLSPDLEAYFPYIQMVFGAKTSQIGYSVHGLSLALAEENSQALMFFFSLAESRFDRSQVLKFFSFPSVMRKFGWDLEDVALLEEWFEKAHVLWGFDPEHKKLCLDQTWPEQAFKGTLPEQGTWEEGISRLIKGLAIDLESYQLSEEEIPSLWPLGQVEWGDAELLGKFIRALYSLQEDLKTVYKKEEKKISQWVSFIQKWILSYFEKTAVEEALIGDLESLKEELEGKVLFSLPFTSFRRVIETHFKRKKESFQSSHLNTVKFLSMQLGASFPAKVICALGCDEGSFPRSPKPSCLDETGKLKETPSVTEQDRYLFLEMILNARKAFLCTYQRISWKDQKEQGPSLLIQDLMNDLDKNCFFEGVDLKPSEAFIRHHPTIHFDQRYFQEEGFHSFSPSVYSLAQSYYGMEKSVMPSFCTRREKDDFPPTKLFEIKKLQGFAKDPIHLYFKEKLWIFFDFVLPKEEEFFLSPLLRSQVKKEAFQNGFKAAILRAQAKGQLPLGEVGQMAVQELKKDLEEWQEHLQFFQIMPENVFCLELSEDAKMKITRDGKVVLPPLTVDVEGIGTVSIVGEMEFICPQGFLWSRKASKSHYIELFISSLILACLSKSKALEVESKGFLLETGKIFSLAFEDPFKTLELYIKLYMRSLEEMCQVRPDWALDFLVKTKEEIEKKRISSTSFKGFVDPYEEWMLKRESFPKMDQILDLWEKDWKELFSPLLEAGVK